MYFKNLMNFKTFICFTIILLFSSKIISSDPNISYTISQTNYDSKFHINQNQNNLEFNYTLTTKIQNKDDIVVSLEQTNNNSIDCIIDSIIPAPSYVIPAQAGISKFFITANIKNINPNIKYITFINKTNQEPKLIQSYLIKDALKPNTVIYDPCKINLQTIKKNEFRKILLNIYGADPYKKTIEFLDINNDNSIDLITIKKIYVSKKNQEINFYQGNSYIKNFCEKYKTYLLKPKFKLIPENEIGVFKYTGERDQIKLSPIQDEIIIQMFDLGKNLMQNFDNLTTFSLSGYDKFMKKIVNTYRLPLKSLS